MKVGWTARHFEQAMSQSGGMSSREAGALVPAASPGQHYRQVSPPQTPSQQARFRTVATNQGPTAFTEGVVQARVARFSAPGGVPPPTSVAAPGSPSVVGGTG